MEKEIITRESLEQDVSNNYAQLLAARDHNEKDLVKLFEHRMNRSLDLLGDYFHHESGVELAK